MSFYRIYRPQVIADLDNLAAREILLSLFQKTKKTLPHAFLLSGPRGTGKTTTARLIAKLYRCEKPKEKGPCGKCKECTSIASGTSIDVMEIDAASNTGVDNIRELRERIALAPSSGEYKIYIIDEVHMLSTGAFNALLKTLEEPPAHAVFILATTDREKVPVTVRSRCTEIIFQKATREEMRHALTRVIREEKLNVKDDALALIIAAADGAFRDAVKYLEQASFVKKTITVPVVESLLSSATVSGKEKLFDAVFLDKDCAKAFHLVEDMVSSGVDMKGFMTEITRDLQAMLVASVESKKIPFDPDDVSQFLKKMMTAFADVKVSPLPQLPLELAIFDTIGDEGSKIVEIRSKPALSEAEVTQDRRPKVDDVPKTPASPLGGQNLRSKTEDLRSSSVPGLLTLEKLVAHWSDYIDALKPYNNSVAGVLRSARPKKVGGGVVTIEAFYKFHQERLSDGKVRDILSTVLHKLFGEKVSVEIVLGKK